MIKDEKRTKAQLLEELHALRKQLSELNRLKEKQQGLIKSLKENEKKYRNLIDRTPDLIFTVDRDGLFTYVNPRLEDTLGYSFAELKGRPFSLIADPDTVLLSRDHHERCMGGESLPPYEAALISKEGRTIPMELNVDALRDAAGQLTGCFGIGRDMTERKRAEAIHRQSEEKFSRAFHASPSLMAIRSLEDGRFIDVNEAYVRTTGFSREELVGRTSVELGLVQEDDRNRVRKALELQGTVRDVEVSFKTRGGEARTGLISTETIRVEGERCLLSVVSDITERKRAEQALRESEDVFRLLFEKSGDANLLIDDGKYIDCNEAALRMAGCSDKAALLNLAPADISPERQPDGLLSSEKARQMIEIALRDGAHRFEWVRKRFDGTEKYLDVMLTAVPMKGKKLIYTTWRDMTERKRAEEALRESEQRCRHLMEHAPAVMFEFDFRTGRLSSVNEIMCRYLGYNREELLEMGLEDLLTEESRNGFEKRLGPYLEGREISGSATHRVRTKDGRELHVGMNARIISENGVPVGASVIAHDVTELRQTEDALREQSRFLQRLIDSVPIAIYYKDTEGVYLGCNRAFEEYKGLSREFIIGKTTGDLWPADLADAFVRADSELFKTRGVQIFESPIPYRDGAMRTVVFHKATFQDKDGAVAGLIGSFFDITERKRMEEAVRESEEKYRLTVENSAEAIFVVQDGVVKFSNETAQKRSGYSTGELAQTFFLDHVHPEDKAIIADRYRRRMMGEKVPNQYEVRFISRTGELIYAQSNVVSVSWEGRPAQLIFASDITEKKKLEIQLQQAQKMEAIGTLAGGIAHDFNNILSAIMGYTEMTMHHLSKEGRGYDYLTRVFRASERARELVRQILDFSRQGKRVVKPVMLIPLITESLKLLRASLPKTIRIVQQIETEHDLVMADPTQIHQVIMNLCTNAAHSMREQGGILTISLTGRMVTGADLAPFPGLTPGSYVVLAVNDTGHGIDPAILDRIFDPFFTTKTRGEGTGMGLSVVHGIVRSHNGYVTIDSRMGEGTTFYVYLPFLAEGKAVMTDEVEAPVIGGRERILFVDDETELTELVSVMLADIGYDVVSRTDGFAALDLFRGDPYQFDLVITDQIMPNMTGVTLAQALLKIRPDIPIILSTGFSEAVTPEMIQSIGIKGYVMKPIIQKQIDDIIRRVLEPAASPDRNEGDGS